MIDAGDAWFNPPDERRVGRVLAAFRHAIYLQVDGSVLAVVSADVPPGPLHLRVRALPTASVGGTVEMALDAPRRWHPPPADPLAVVAVAPDAAVQLDLADRSELARDGTADAASVAVASGDLVALVRHLGGRGHGLTPAGDDVLAGIVFVLASAGWDHANLGAAVADTRTHPISLAFLEWAARGQAVEPIHDLLAALLASDAHAVSEHQDRVAAIGHTSGVDLLLGLRLGLTCLS